MLVFQKNLSALKINCGYPGIVVLRVNDGPHFCERRRRDAAILGGKVLIWLWNSLLYFNVISVEIHKIG